MVLARSLEGTGGILGPIVKQIKSKMKGEICINCWFVFYLLSDESKLPQPAWPVTHDLYAVVQFMHQ